MNVRLVGHEGAAAAAHATQHHAQHVEAGHHEECEAQHQGVRLAADAHGRGVVGLRAVHAEPYSGKAQHKAHHLRAGVAHEYLAVLLRVAEHVEVEEGHQRAQHGGADGGGHVEAVGVEHAGQEEQGHDAQPRGQTVDAVDEVDGVDDEHQHEHRQRLAYPPRYLPDAEEAV